jgi:hypothetical protein
MELFFFSGTNFADRDEDLSAKVISGFLLSFDLTTSGSGFGFLNPVIRFKR